MIDDWQLDSIRRAKAARIDPAVPNAARVADFLNGDRNNFEADRRAARIMLGAAPAIAAIVPAVLAFQQRAARFLAAEAGVRQFIDVGTGLPGVETNRDIFRSAGPRCRVVYVDNDPMVLSHARALMKSAPGGAVGYVDADVRDPRAIVEGAKSILDFSQPIAVMLLFTLAYVQDAGEAAAVVSSLRAAVPSGSYFAVYHLASDLDVSMEEVIRQWNKMMPTQAITLRSGQEVADLLVGLEPVPPGLAPVTEWRPAPSDPRFDHGIPVHGIVARRV